SGSRLATELRHVGSRSPARGRFPATDGDGAPLATRSGSHRCARGATFAGGPTATVSAGGVPRCGTPEQGRVRDPTIDVASACGPDLVVQSFGPRTVGVPIECGLRGIARQWQP